MFMLCLKNNFYKNCFEFGEQLNGAMKWLGLAGLVCFLGCEPAPVYGQSVIRCLAWELDTARPAVKEWSLVRGETVDLECRYLAGASAMDVRGAAVVLHCRTNGMPADVSYQVTGRVGRVTSTNLASVGWVTVRVRPDLDLPHDVKSCTFTLETTLDSARNLVATGLLRLAGDPTGATPAAVRVFRYQLATDAQAASNALAGALAHALTSSVPAQITSATGGLANAASVAAAIAAIPPPSTDARRVVSDDGNEWRDGTGGVWRVTYTPFTNIACTLSNPFGRLVAPDMYDRPEQSVFVGAYGAQIDAGNSWFVSFDAANDGFYTVYNYFSGDTWSVSGQQPPTVAHPEDGALFGTAAFTYQVTYTAVTSRVDTVALLSDLDALPKPTGDASRLVSSNALAWIDGEGNRWRIEQQAVTNADQLIMFNSNFDWYGVVTLNRVFELNEWSAIPESDVLFYAGDVYQESLFYVACWNTEWDQASYSMCLPSDLTTFPKVFNNPINGHTGWVDRVVTIQPVTSLWAEVANKADILSPIPAAFTNVPLYSYSGSNYYWRWSSAAGTFVTTGVAQ